MELQQEMANELANGTENSSLPSYQQEAEERIQIMNHLLWQELNDPAQKTDFPLWGMWK